MWTRLAEVGNNPLAILIGFAIGRWARRRGESPWTAYAVALIPGVILAAVSEYWFGEHVLVWGNALVWLTWTGFGVFCGWREPRKKPVLTGLNLSGREPS